MFKKRKNNKQNKPKKSPQALALDAMAMFITASAFGLFNNRMNHHTTTLKVYAPKSGPYFWIYKYGSSYLHKVLEWLTQIFQTPDAFGWAVIVLTIIVKLISLFNRLLVAKMSINANQRQRSLQSQLDYIKKAMLYAPLTDQQTVQLKTLQNECLKKNKAVVKRWPYYINMILSIIIMTALYQSVAYSTSMHDIYFLGIDLSQRSALMTAISSLLYAISSIISWNQLGQEVRAKTSQIYYFITPVTTFLSGYFLPSIITLYWITSASCLIIQYIFTYWLIYPLFRKQATKNFKPKTVITKDKVLNIIHNTH